MSDEKGLKCKGCGGRLFRTTHTKKQVGRIKRRRVCENCGWSTTTYERPAEEK